VRNNGLRGNVQKFIPQMYAAAYHSLLKTNEPIFKSAQTMRMIFEKEMGECSDKLAQKIELIASANRKLAEKAPNEAALVSSKAFKENERQVREAIRTAVDAIVTDVYSVVD